MIFKPNKPVPAFSNLSTLFLIRVCCILFLSSGWLYAIPVAANSPNLYSPENFTRYEAEDAVLTGVNIAKSLPGFSGTGYMDGGSFDQTGDKITFKVTVPVAASYPLIVRFQNTCGACEKAQNISVNGGPDKYTVFNGTGSSWQDLNCGTIDLKAGENTIAISKSWGWTHIDYIAIGENDVTPPSIPQHLQSGATTQTSALLSWDASTDDDAVAGYEVYFGNNLKVSTAQTSVNIDQLTCGTEYPEITVRAKDRAGNVSGSSEPLTLSTAACQLYTIRVVGGTGGGSYYSGTKITITADPATSGKIFDRWTGFEGIVNPAIAIATIVVPEADVEITATYKDIDPTPLIDPQATPETVALWNYLKSVYGQKMLTGCWTESQFGGNAKVYSCTGEMPAIWGQDMNSWYRDRNEFNWKNTWNGNIQGFKTAHNRGQILQINWHWQMPSSKVNGVYTRDAWGKDASGNVKMMTTQEWADMVTPGTALYDAMIEDIDYHVENFLKKIVDANGIPIPIIFRPLHEIDGGWFWWTCPSDPSKTAKLYQILQDRIMNYHGCHNLIWVYNPGVICNGGSWPPYQSSETKRRKAFYPGDTYCDITGIDLYDFDPAGRATYSGTGKTYRDAWNLMKSIAPDKMIALCESEGLPNPEKCFTDPNYAPWLYCLPWYSDNYTDATSGVKHDLCAWNQIQFKSGYVINAGDFLISESRLVPVHEKKSMKIFPNPASGKVTVAFTPVKSGANSSVKLVTPEGKVVLEQKLNAEDQLIFDTKGLKRGWYLVQLRQGSKYFCEKLLIK